MQNFHAALAFTDAIDTPTHPVAAGVRQLWYPTDLHYNAGETAPLCLTPSGSSCESPGSDWTVIVRATHTAYTTAVLYNSSNSFHPFPPGYFQRSTPTYAPPLFAVREYGKGRVAVMAQWRQYTVGSGSAYLFDNQVRDVLENPHLVSLLCCLSCYVFLFFYYMIFLCGVHAFLYFVIFTGSSCALSMYSHIFVVANAMNVHTHMHMRTPAHTVSTANSFLSRRVQVLSRGANNRTSDTGLLLQNTIKWLAAPVVGGPGGFIDSNTTLQVILSSCPSLAHPPIYTRS